MAENLKVNGLKAGSLTAEGSMAAGPKVCSSDFVGLERSASGADGASAPDIIRTTAEFFEETALPCRRGVTLTDCDPPEAAETQPLPATLTEEPAADKGQAQFAYERVLHYLQNFERQLDGEHEIALGFAGSDAGVLRIEGIGFFDPDILTFYGRTEDGRRTQLVQHVSQLNLMLQAVPKLTPEDTPPRRFGFELQPPSNDTALPTPDPSQGAVTASQE